MPDGHQLGYRRGTKGRRAVAQRNDIIGGGPAMGG